MHAIIVTLLQTGAIASTAYGTQPPQITMRGNRLGKSYAAKLYVEYLKHFPRKPVVPVQPNQIWFDETLKEEEDKIVGQKRHVLRSLK